METDCPCDICVAEARGCHPWELLFWKHPRAVEAIRHDWEETKASQKNRMQPIYYYDLLKRPYMETRSNDNEIRISETGDTKRFEGYAAVFHSALDSRTEYELIPGKLWERILPTAFHESLNGNREILALYEHDRKAIMGRTSGKRSLRLGVDDRGLKFELDYDGADPDHRKALAKIRGSAQSKGMSFGFTVPPGGDSFIREGGRDIRQLKNIRLHEITLTGTPAYAAANVSMRSEGSYTNYLAAYEEWAETQRLIEIAESYQL